MPQNAQNKACCPGCNCPACQCSCPYCTTVAFIGMLTGAGVCADVAAQVAAQIVSKCCDCNCQKS